MDYELYIFDLDGTLYRGIEAIPGARETVAELRCRGAKIAFITNNSGTALGAIRDRLRGMDFEAEDREIVSSGLGAVAVLKSSGARTAFVVGEPGLRSTLLDGGVEVVEDGQVDAVVVGICRSFDYALLDAAMDKLASGAEFVATNRDATYPIEEGREQPGAGAMVAALEACSGRSPFVVGKPNPLLIQMSLRNAGVSAERALVVGDRYETDIAAGIAAGCATWLVLTGVTTAAPAGQAHSRDLRGLLHD